eukprot:9112_1
MIMILLLLSTILQSISSTIISYDFSINTSDIVRSIPEPYFGFTIDWWKQNGEYGPKWGNAGILTLDLSNTNLIALTKAITPAVLRIGGSPEDSIIYNISGACLNIKPSLPGYGCSEASNTQPYGCLNESRWTQINEFAYKTNVTLVFGLNACYGRPAINKSMNFTNIEQLFNYTVNKMNKTITQNLYGFEYGNSEGQQHGSNPMALIDVDAYSNDFYTLHKLIDKYFNTKKVYAIADDDNLHSQFNRNYSKQFLSNLETYATKDNIKVSDILNRYTYHNYPNCGYPNGKETVFSLSCLNEINVNVNYSLSITSQYGVKGVMGEGSEHSGGGTSNVSNTFVDNFYYLYQLSNTLQNGLYGTWRSDLIGGDYELIDHKTFLPNPDYWILWLWRKFIGDKLYKSVIQTHSNIDNVRGYAFKGLGDEIVIALINYDLQNVANINIMINDGKTGYDFEEYYLKPTDSNVINSRNIYVNDVLMLYNGSFPSIKPVKGNGMNITINPARIVFVISTATN